MSNAFQHACFLSYRNGDRNDPLDLLNNFAEQIYEALSSELRTQLDLDEPIFWDVQSLQGGYILNPHIASAICQSTCMIIIFTRNYLSEKNLFCAAEFYGMLECEANRFQKMNLVNPNKGMIISIALRNPNLVPDILRKRLFYDFSKFTLADIQIRQNPNYVSKIQEIAQFIAQWHDEMQPLENDLCSNCPAYRLPDIDTNEGRQIIMDFIRQHRKLHVPMLQQS